MYVSCTLEDTRHATSRERPFASVCREPGAGGGNLLLLTPPVVCVLFCLACFVTIPPFVAAYRHVPTADDPYCRITHPAPSSVSEFSED